MKRTLLLLLSFLLIAGISYGQADETVQFEAFGKVALVRKSPHPSSVVLFVSGDGGWVGIDREIAEELAHRGVSVVGLNFLKYFWQGRPPA